MATSSSGPAGSTPPIARGNLAAVLEDGVLTGVIGATIVAVWFLVLDGVRGLPFWTPSLIGSVLFLGKPLAEATATVNPVVVFAYTGLHGMLFLAAGTAIAWMISVVERNPQFGIVLLLIFLLFQSVLFGFEVTLVPSVVGALGAWAVAVANLLAAVGMFWFLLRRRPGLLARLREGWEE